MNTTLVFLLAAIGSFHGNYRSALDTHNRTQKPLIVLVGSMDCPPCVKMKLEAERLKPAAFANVEFVSVGFGKDLEIANVLKDRPLGLSPVTWFFQPIGKGKYAKYRRVGYFDLRLWLSPGVKTSDARTGRVIARRFAFVDPDAPEGLQVAVDAEGEEIDSDKALDQLRAKYECKDICGKGCGCGCQAGQQEKRGFSFEFERTTWKEEGGLGGPGREVERVWFRFDWFRENVKALPADILEVMKGLIK